MNNWQLDLLERLQGFKPGEMAVITSSRQTGKSMLQRLWNETYFQEVPCVELGEGRVFDQPYYTAEPKGIVWADMETWCRHTFGPTPETGVWEPLARWYMNGERFWFRDEKDRMLFVLRWSR